MGSRRRDLLAVAVVALCCLHGASAAASFGDNFEITGAEDHVKTSADGQTWYLYLDNKTGQLPFDLPNGAGVSSRFTHSA